MVIAALFTIGKMWKQPHSSLVDKKIQIIYKIYLVCILYAHHIMEYFSASRMKFCHMLHQGWALRTLLNEPIKKDILHDFTWVSNQIHGNRIEWWLPRPMRRRKWRIVAQWVQGFSHAR